MQKRLIFVTFALAAMYAVGAQASPINLLQNPGFEDGLTDWTYSNATIATPADSPPAAHGGSNYVYSDSSPTFSVSQLIDLPVAGVSTTDIDTGALFVAFGGWQSGWGTQTDHGQITITLYDSGGSILGTKSLKSFYSDETWVKQSGSTALLAGTRSIGFEFVGVRDQGINNDAYLDDAFLKITGSVSPPTTSVPEPSPLWLFVIGLVGLGLARWRRARA